jgi:O-antigen/teichoic acid export membrane protein
VQLKLRLKAGSSFSNIATIASGSAIAQAASLLFSPILTRIYAPTAYALFAVFTSQVSAISPGVGGRFELASIVESQREIRHALIALSLLAALIVSVVYVLVLQFNLEWFVAAVGAQSLGGWIWFVPVALLGSGAINSLRAICNSQDSYRVLSASSVVQSIGFTGLALLLASASRQGGALVSAFLLSTVVTVFHLTWTIAPFKRLRVVLLDQVINYKQLLKVAKQYKDYPLVSAPMSVANGVMSAMPLLFLSAHYPVEIVGQYSLMARIGGAPFSLFYDAISRVQMKAISSDINDGRDPSVSLIRWATRLLAIVLVPTIIAVVFAPSVFAIVFGERWRDAGRFLRIAMPGLAVQFVVSSLSMSWVALGNVRTPAKWQAASLFLTFVACTWGATFRDVEAFLFVLVSKDVFLYSAYFLLLVIECRKTDPQKMTQV